MIARRIGCLCLITWVIGSSAWSQPAQTKRALWTSAAPGLTSSDSDSGCIASFRHILAKSRPSVVAIHTVSQKSMAKPKLLLDPFHLFDEEDQVQGVGSGFIIRSDGLILTNHHVIEYASQLWVILNQPKQRKQATVLGSDARTDLALLKIEPAKPLSVLSLGDSDSLQMGDWVVAIGNPFGLTFVASKGIVSGKSRSIQGLLTGRVGLVHFIQTDALMNYGNSGGPLLNTAGEVVGISAAINAKARGIGFAIPVNLAKAVIPHLYKSGKLVRSYLGISINDLTYELAEQHGLQTTDGVVITEVTQNTPAALAGLQKGDIVVRFDGKAIQSRGDLTWRATTWPAGKPVKVVIWRNHKQQTLDVTPIRRKSTNSRRPAQANASPPNVPALLGLQVANLDKKTLEKSGLPRETRGVVVVASCRPSNGKRDPPRGCDHGNQRSTNRLKTRPDSSNRPGNRPGNHQISYFTATSGLVCRNSEIGAGLTHAQTSLSHSKASRVPAILLSFAFSQTWNCSALRTVQLGKSPLWHSFRSPRLSLLTPWLHVL